MNFDQEPEMVFTEVRQRPLPIEETLNIAIRMTEGLHAAHERGIVHRDIKSANVMVTGKGQVKIMNFGLAAHPKSGSGCRRNARAQTRGRLGSA